MHGSTTARTSPPSPQEVSTDTGSGASGGALSTRATGGACTDVATFSSTYVPEFVAAALAAEVGVPTAPVESQFGYHVILVRPFAEVGDEVVAALQQAELAPKAAELFDGVTISVSPSIGTWSSSSKPVTAIDAAPDGA